MPDVHLTKTKALYSVRNHTPMVECVSGFFHLPLQVHFLPFTTLLLAFGGRCAWTVLMGSIAPLVFDWVCQWGAVTEAGERRPILLLGLLGLAVSLHRTLLPFWWPILLTSASRFLWPLPILDLKMETALMLFHCPLSYHVFADNLFIIPSLNCPICICHLFPAGAQTDYLWKTNLVPGVSLRNLCPHGI